MADADERPGSDDPPDSEAETIDGGAMASLETHFGRPVDPGVDLDGADNSEDETRVGAGSPAPTGGTAAATTERYENRGEIARGGSREATAPPRPLANTSQFLRPTAMCRRSLSASLL